MSGLATPASQVKVVVRPHPYAPGVTFLSTAGTAYLVAPFVAGTWIPDWLNYSFAFAFGISVATDFLLNKPYRNASSGLERVNRLSQKKGDIFRLTLKTLGNFVLLAIAALGTLPILILSFDVSKLPSLWVFAASLPAFVLVGIFVDKRQRKKRDAFWIIGAAIISCRLRKLNAPALRQMAFSFLQGFFGAFGLAVFITSATQASEILNSDIDGAFYVVISFWIFLNLGKATICIGGFALCTRLLDNHVRSVDRNITSWLVTLACYPPLFDIVDRGVGGLDRAYEWSGFFEAGSPAFYFYAGLVVVVGILYGSEMLVWGARFSNLTYRGLITRGPFALFRHPAYLTKCVHFWLIALPLFAPDQRTFWIQTSQLLFLSGLYWIRARLEDQHLRSHAEYRLYERSIFYGLSRKFLSRWQ